MCDFCRRLQELEDLDRRFPVFEPRRELLDERFPAYEPPADLDERFPVLQPRRFFDD